jgi:ureidoglycolate lyase
MSRAIAIEPLEAAAFHPFGDVIEAAGSPDKVINAGMCGRFNDRARLDFCASGRAGISVFLGQPYDLPLALAMMERHPLGSQAFLPLSGDPFLVIAAADEGGAPGRPRAFLTRPGQGVNLLRGTWHGVLTPLGRAAAFAVVDYIGPVRNLEEHHFAQGWTIARPGA